ncbi:hypothetical protein [Nocardia jiangxiensis]|uniref:hypothetical protein n=1 Tax=Nocardia jiangxiensis TaxID=282685 RepID=UPI0005926611|nr:hypothetical protein [Nocardia jiangxiensis]
MSGKKKSPISARRQARERLAQERAEQAARNRENEADLADFLALEQRLEAADFDRDEAMNTARARHRVAVEKLKHRQGLCLARMSRRGETNAAISNRTGLTTREIKQLISEFSDVEADQSSQGPNSRPAIDRSNDGWPASGIDAGDMLEQR